MSQDRAIIASIAETSLPISQESDDQKYRLLACPTCDLLHRVQRDCQLIQYCSRCEGVLQRPRPRRAERALAFSLTALILFIIANSFPFLAMKSGSFVQETLLSTGIYQLWLQHEYLLAVLILLTCILAPLLQIASLLYLLVPMQFDLPNPPAGASVLRFLKHLAPWAMMEVFMISILVAMVKLGKMATIIPGISVAAFAALIFIMPAALTSLNWPQLWERFDLRR